MVVVVVLFVIDQQRLCNGQEIMRTTTKVKLDIHKSHRGCCSFAAWEGSGRQDRHHHEAHDGGIGSYGDKRARETNIQIGLLGPGVSQEKSCHWMQQQQQKKKKKKPKEAHRTRSTIMRQKWVYIFAAFTMPGIYIQGDLTCLSALHDIYQDSGKTTNTDHDKSVRDG